MKSAFGGVRANIQTVIARPGFFHVRTGGNSRPDATDPCLAFFKLAAVEQPG